MKNKLCFLTIFVLLFSLSCGKKKEPVKEADTWSIDARVNLTLGVVNINGKPVKADAKVNYGDIIDTDKDSACEILIGTKNLLKLGANSKLTFNISRDNNSFILEKGWLSGITRDKFTKEGKYNIKTPTVVASVRGTSYCIKVEKPESTYFCVCNGSINLEGKGEKGVDVVSTHHIGKRFMLDKNGKVKTDANPGMLYHNDKGVEEMAAKIQEKVDWKKAF